MHPVPQLQGNHAGHQFEHAPTTGVVAPAIKGLPN